MQTASVDLLATEGGSRPFRPLEADVPAESISHREPSSNRLASPAHVPAMCVRTVRTTTDNPSPGSTWFHLSGLRPRTGQYEGGGERLLRRRLLPRRTTLDLDQVQGLALDIYVGKRVSQGFPDTKWTVRLEQVQCGQVPWTWFNGIGDLYYN